jgi:hypothetical protein
VALVAAIRRRTRRHEPPDGRVDLAATTVRYAGGLFFAVPAVLCVVGAGVALYQGWDGLRANRLGGIAGSVELRRCEWVEGTQSCTGPFRSTDGEVTLAKVGIDPGDAPNQGDTVGARVSGPHATHAWRPGNGWIGYFVGTVALLGLGTLAGFIAAPFYRPVRAGERRPTDPAQVPARDVSPVAPAPETPSAPDAEWKDRAHG